MASSRGWWRVGFPAVAGAVVGMLLGLAPAMVRVAGQAGAGALVDPALYKELYYRPLTVFSRGGRVTAVAGVPSNPKLYYMGSAGGVWRTTDAGARWEPITDGQIGAGSIGAIAVADANPSIIYVGTGSACPRGNVSNGDGVYKSTDGGTTWQHVGLPKAGLIGRIRIHPQNPDLVYVAALGNIFGPNRERGVFRSKDGGRTWEHVLAVSENTGAVDLSMDPRNPNVLFAAMWTVRRVPWSIDSGSLEGGLFRSTDGGDTWQRLTKGLPQGVMVGRIGVSVSPVDSKRVYALIEAAGDQGGVYRSDDGGESWTRTYAGRNLQQRAFYYTHIYADPKDVDTVWALNTGAYKSTDGGKAFQSAGIQSHGDHHDLWINPTNPQYIVNGNDGGATVSVDGGKTWSPQNNQPTAEIYRIEVDTRWPYWVYGAQQDSGTVAVPSSNVGETYGVGGGESGYVAVDPRNYNLIYAGNYGGSITRTDRYLGISEQVRVYADSQTGQRAADMKYRFQWNAPIRISPHDPDTVYTTSQYVHRTRDGGQTWEAISPDLTRNDRRTQDYSGAKGITRDNTGVEVYSTIFAFEESPVTPGLLWAGSDDGLVHLSRDHGKTWENITPPGLPEFSTVNVIDLSPRQAGRAIVTAYRYMLNDPTPYAFLTTDHGKTWKRLADGTNGVPVGHFLRVVREDPDRPGLLYGGTEYGMYISFDEGGHWQRFQNNLPVVPIMDLKVYRNELIVATEGRGFWILEGLPVLRQLRAGLDRETGVLFAPADAYRQGGPLPTFYYWLKDQPTAPVTIEIRDSSGTVVYSASGQPGSGVTTPPSPVPAPATGRGRGGRGFAAPEEAPGAAAAPGAAPFGQAGQPAGRGGRGGGAGGLVVSAHQGLNRTTWSARLASPYTVPPGIVMWGGGRGAAQGPKAAPGVYTVTVATGGWSQTRTFRLKTDPRFPPMTDEAGAEQLRMALDVAAQIRQLYDTLAKIRDAKQQAAALAEKAKSSKALVTAARTLTDRLVAVEGEITQLQGEGGQDALNYPGRLDNQWVALYGAVVALERPLTKAVTERYADLKPPTDDLMRRASAVLTADVAAFNAVAARAGLRPGIVLK